MFLQSVDLNPAAFLFRLSKTFELHAKNSLLKFLSSQNLILKNSFENQFRI